MSRAENILVLGNPTGSGGREEALRWRLGQNRTHGLVYGSPGNARTILDNRAIQLDGFFVDAKPDFDRMAEHLYQLRVGTTIIGPEKLIEMDVASALRRRGLEAFGHNADDGKIETDKADAEQFNHRHGVAHFHAESFEHSQQQEAKDYIRRNIDRRMVIKYSLLANGKGVRLPEYITPDQYLEDCYQTIDEFTNIFSQKGRLLIQDFGEGKEVSLIAIVSGTSYKIFPRYLDYKWLDGQETGGMGGYLDPEEDTQEFEETILKPALAGWKKEGKNPKGVLYAGVMLTSQGPKLFEWNARFGDPDTQAQVMQVDNLEELITAAMDDRLDQVETRLIDQAAVCFVLAAPGYPQKPVTGMPIYGLDKFRDHPNIQIFHNNTRLDDGQVVVSGGRAISVVGTGHDIASAREAALSAIGPSAIHFQGMQYLPNIAEGI